MATSVVDDPRWQQLFALRLRGGEQWSQSDEADLQQAARLGEIPQQFLSQVRMAPVLAATEAAPVVPSMPASPPPVLSFADWLRQTTPPAPIGPHVLDPRTAMQTPVPPPLPTASAIPQAPVIVTPSAWEDVPPGPLPAQQPQALAREWAKPPLPPAAPPVRTASVEMLQVPVPPIEPPMPTPPTPGVIGAMPPVTTGQPPQERIPQFDRRWLQEVAMLLQTPVGQPAVSDAQLQQIQTTLAQPGGPQYLPPERTLPEREMALGLAPRRTGGGTMDPFRTFVPSGALEEAEPTRGVGFMGTAAVNGLRNTLQFLPAASQYIQGANQPGVIAGLTGLADDIARALKPVEQGIQPRILGDPIFWDKLMSGVGSSLVSLLPGAAARTFLRGVSTAAPQLTAQFGAGATSGLIEGAMEAGNLYDQLVPKVGEAEAAARAMKSFALNAALVSLTDSVGIFGNDALMLRHVANGIVTNGLQEAVQYDIERRQLWLPLNHPEAPNLLLQGWARDRDRVVQPFSPKDATESTIIGALIGGGASTLIGLSDVTTRPIPTPRSIPPQELPSATMAEEARPVAPTPSPPPVVPPPSVPPATAPVVPTPAVPPSVGPRETVPIQPPTPAVEPTPQGVPSPLMPAPSLAPSPPLQAVPGTPTPIAGLDAELVRLATDLGMATTPEAQQTLLDTAHQVYAQAQQQGTDPAQAVRQWFGTQVPQETPPPEEVAPPEPPVPSPQSQQGEAPRVTPEAPPVPSPAPATFLGWQEGPAGTPPMALWNLTEDIPSHPRHSTVSTDTLREAGYQVEEPMREEGAPPSAPAQPGAVRPLPALGVRTPTLEASTIPAPFVPHQEIVQTLHDARQFIEQVRPDQWTPAQREQATHLLATLNRIRPDQLSVVGWRGRQAMADTLIRSLALTEPSPSQTMGPPGAVAPQGQPTPVTQEGISPITPFVPPGAQLPLLRPSWDNAAALLQQVREAQQSVTATDAAPIADADELFLEHVQQLQDLTERYLRELPTPRAGSERQRLGELRHAQEMLQGLRQRLAGLRELPADAPIVRLAKRLAVRMGFRTLPRSLVQLQQLADVVYGGTRAQGAYTPDDLYDAIELAMNLYVLNDPEALFDATGDVQHALRAIEVLDELRAELPTKTVRTEETNTLQQFSTPPGYAFAVNWLANLQPGDRVLEPSAGTGNLAVFAARVVGMDHVQVNEIATRRLQILTALGFPNPTQADALFLHSILMPRGLPRPSAVVMNPPFSSMAQQGGYNPQVGARHVEEALKHLAEGGRLVAIVGRGMAPDAATFRDFWRRIMAQYTVRANVGVEGAVYRKMGTSFGTRVLIIDKGAATTPGTVRTGDVETIQELVQLLKDVRYARTFTTQPAPGEPGSPQVADQNSAVDRPPTAVSPPAYGVGLGSPTPGPGQEAPPPVGTRPAGTEGTREPGGRAPVPSVAPPTEGGRPQPARPAGGRRPRRPGPAPTAGPQPGQEPAGGGLNQPTPPEREAPGTPVRPAPVDFNLSDAEIDALLDKESGEPAVRPRPAPTPSPAATPTPQAEQPQPIETAKPSTAIAALNAAIRDLLGSEGVEEEAVPYGAWVDGVKPEIYARLHPLFQAAEQEAERAGTGLQGLVQGLFAEHGARIRPYVKQYILARRAQQTVEAPLAEEPADSQFKPYVVQQLKVPNAKPHPAPIVETLAMASVMPPPVTYTPQIDPRVIASVAISLPQL